MITTELEKRVNKEHLPLCKGNKKYDHKVAEQDERKSVDILGNLEVV